MLQKTMTVEMPGALPLTRKRNTLAMLASPRCGAKTRAGNACQAPAVFARERCRMHGGAAGSGAPRDNKNALKSGLYTCEMIAHRRRVNEVLRLSRDAVRQFG